MNASMGLAQNIVDVLIGRGIREAVLAPGSRSGPLALALHRADQQGRLRLHVRVDERTAGFLALGMAKASRRMVAVITTSGTAVANLYPAVLEAKHASIGLLVISADRPARLRGTGANQTTDQIAIFKNVAFAGINAQDNAEAVIDGLLTAAANGPAQLNTEFDEPLIGSTENLIGSTENIVSTIREQAQTIRTGSTAVEISTDKATVVVAGDDARQDARRLAEEARWPLMAEPSSGSRTGETVIGAYRLLLQHSPLAKQIERVVMFGHPTLSRPVIQLLLRADLEVIVVGADLAGLPGDGSHARLIPAAAVPAAADPRWLHEWQQQGKLSIAAISAVTEPGPLNGYEIARAVAATVRPGGLLYVGSSNSIRDLDLVAPSTPVGQKRLTLANRGLSGIDGTLSSAIGAALARASTTAHALVGDLTFLHDANALLIGPSESRPDLTIVVSSDDGGSIFATLEQGADDYADAFERVYATPTGADIGLLCRGYGIEHTVVANLEQLETALVQPVRGIRVIEARIDRFSRRELAEQISTAVSHALR